MGRLCYHFSLLGLGIILVAIAGSAQPDKSGQPDRCAYIHEELLDPNLDVRSGLGGRNPFDLLFPVAEAKPDQMLGFYQGLWSKFFGPPAVREAHAQGFTDGMLDEYWSDDEQLAEMSKERRSRETKSAPSAESDAYRKGYDKGRKWYPKHRNERPQYFSNGFTMGLCMRRCLQVFEERAAEATTRQAQVDWVHRCAVNIFWQEDWALKRWVPGKGWQYRDPSAIKHARRELERGFKLESSKIEPQELMRSVREFGGSVLQQMGSGIRRAFGGSGSGSGGMRPVKQHPRMAPHH